MHPPTDFDTSDPDGRVPAEIRDVVLKTLEKKPEDRFPSARHLRDALEPARADHQDSPGRAHSKNSPKLK